MTLLHADDEQEAGLIGEDTTELFALIEDSFAIELGNYWELDGITIGELARKIDNQVNFPAPDQCLSAVAFYELRRALSAVVRVPRCTIRPDTGLRTLLRWRNRRKDWREVEACLGLVLPNLTSPTWLVIFCLVLSALVLVYLRYFGGLQLNAWQIVFGSFALCYPLAWACIPFARMFPRKCDTVGDLAKIVLARNYSAFAAKRGSSYEKGILPSLQLLIATATNLAPSSVTPETRIPADLGID
jgi:hypothetical protein